MYYIASLLILLALPVLSEGYDHEHSNKNCTGKLSLKKVVDCVLDHSPEYRFARQEMEALKGRQKVAGYLFPSNPYITAGGSHRKNLSKTSPFESSGAFNAELSFSQEIYTTNQRGTKLEIANSESRAQLDKVYVVERSTVTEAVAAALAYQNSIKEFALTQEIFSLTKEIYEAIHTRSEKGLLPPIDADLARSELVQMNHVLQMAKRKLDASKANLTVMMGVSHSASLEIYGELSDKLIQKKALETLLSNAIKIRQEVFLQENQIKAAILREKLLRQERTPNATLTAFVMRDGFNEGVFGGRVSLPLNLWRDKSGELYESRAKIEQSISMKEVQLHSIKYEVISAFSAYHSLSEEYMYYDSTFMKRIDQDLFSVKQAITLGQIPIRDALISQRSLVSLKLAYLQTELELELSKLELLRASGMEIL
jgi:outer membrane protein TolC